MQHHTHTALYNNIFGVLGGVEMSILEKPLLLATRLPDSSVFIIYTAASAVGCLVKNGFLSD
jgi:hypothetical protein